MKNMFTSFRLETFSRYNVPKITQTQKTDLIPFVAWIFLSASFQMLMNYFSRR